MITRSLIEGREGEAGGAKFQGREAATGRGLEPWFHAATAADLERAARAADAAQADYRRRSGRERGAFLRAIAQELEAAAPELVARAGEETGLAAARLQGETARTANQLRLFAALVEEGSWVEARLDRAQERSNAPRKPELRSLLRPLGPVAVFGASNFPLAFSVAGGDTASALAAGNAVIVKAHPAHPGTSALAGEAVARAAAATGMPAGVFGLLFDDGIEVGAALVRHPLVQAVGFTGSQAAGRRLMDLAAARPEPIPVYAEMGSSNPVFVLPRALAERGEAIAQGLQASVTLGAGQFCTKPGVVVAAAGEAGEALAAKLAELMGAAPAFTLLTAGIARSFQAGKAARAGHAAVRTLAASPAANGALLLQTEAAALLADPELGEELFGPATLLVRHQGKAELLQVARALRGHLTATVHGTEADLQEYAELLEILEQKVGRVVINGYPTGVEVTHAMVHGGPYPASSSRETSVGTRAIVRFARPVCYQDMPDFALPPELQAANPLGIWRLVDGEPTRAGV
ncbi:MAG TPA: aldehyde dehydrogenase (NADP(+)) [Terriglobales bacterium]|nr:aldehyde dehydrogenase (NADP(+)) [Terriglobales bacterium]